MKIAVLGAGAFGTALGGILADKGYDIDYYDSRLEREKLSDVLADAKYIVLCVPSKAAPYLLPYLPKDKPLIVATKGILSDKAFDDFKDFMVLSGPGFADDIKAAKNTKLTATDDRIIGLFETNYLTFDKTNDKRGVLMCGALKNVYAILAGLEELEPNTEEHARFLTDVSEEMKALLSGRILCKNPNAEPEKTVEGISALKRIKRGEIIVPIEAVKLKDLMSRSDKWA